MKKFLFCLLLLVLINSGASVNAFIFDDNFDSGTSIGVKWSGSTQCWSDITNAAMGTGTGTPGCSVFNNIINSADFNSMDFNFNASISGGDTKDLFLWFLAKTDFDTNGYFIYVSPSDPCPKPICLRGYTETLGQYNIACINYTITANQFYDVNVGRANNGQIFFYFDNNFVGAFYDVNYTKGTKFVIRNDGAQTTMGIDNFHFYTDDETVNIDLNFVAIDNYVVSEEFPAFIYNIDGNLTIDFNVFNFDNNIMSVDINYGTDAEQGSGTVIVHDFNLSSAFCTNAQNWKNNVGQCSIDWNIFGVPDGNYYIKIDLNGGSKLFTATGKSMWVRTPYLKLQVWDENKGYPLVSPSISFNGTTYSLDNQGKVSLAVSSISGVYTVKIWEDSNYTARYFDFDLNSTSVFDLNVFLLHDGNGQSVSFKFYDTDQTTILPSVLVRLRHDNNISSMRYTDTSGETSFFLDPDDNYVFEIVKSGTEVLHYYPTQLTINIPKNESTLANITPFGVTGSQLAQKNWIAQSAALTYYILANTVGYYSFDFNATDYNPRNYLVSVKGNPATYSLQAYLPPKTIDGETISGSYTFIVTNSISLNPISNVLIKVKRNISGLGETEIASITTDSAGQATTTLQYYVEYNLYFYYNGQLVFVTQNTPTPTPAYFQVQLAISAISPNIPILGVFSVGFKPFNHNIFLNSIGLADVNISVSLLNKTLSTMRITIKDSANRIISEKYFTSPWTDGNFANFDLNLLDFNRNRMLIAIVDVNSTDGNNYHADFGWSVFSEDQWAISNLLSAFAGSNNKMVLGFIALFITLLAVGAACITSLVPGDPLLLSLMTIFILFFWVSIGFLELIPVVFIALFVVFLALLTKAVM